jgi:cytoskeletal protein CcmA (bactofilin family)
MRGCISSKSFTVHGTLTLNGRLHVKGDLDVRGSMTGTKLSELIVEGKRTIHGSVKKEVI